MPVWRLFRDKAPFAGVPLYATINRALQTRSVEEYSTIVEAVRRQGFTIFKCAPFEAVNSPDAAVEKSAAGLATLKRLRGEFPDLGIRVDFHERFTRPADFYAILPELERVRLVGSRNRFQSGPPTKSSDAARGYASPPANCSGVTAGLPGSGSVDGPT